MKYFSLLVPFSFILACSPHIDGPPELAIVSRIDVEYFPETNQGKPWDPEENNDNTRPDVYMVINAKNRSYLVHPRIENASGSLVFKHGDLPIYLQHPEDEITFEILDQDGGSVETIYSGTMTIWQSSGDENEHAVEFKKDDLKVLFTVTFDYNN